ncbi:hypothetical protein ACHQM5_022617 [Ranunculus cassubicifolius]
MVMKSLLAFFFRFIYLKRRSSKESSSYLLIESNVVEKIDEDQDISSGIGEYEYCSICLSGWGEEAQEVRKLSCSHVFHKSCVDQWLNLFRKTCPLCRTSVEGESSRKKDELTEEMVVWFSSFHVAGL